ncbi:tetratricopeptide repeat protein [Flammeovirga kamogawensis]|uniref:Tetratricopeptide repeat protein n=1 Tax=Flammeovirga kamogawensis TaxID=373891 RepID=A0ABX8GWK8_9BACT|nr:tetratricopeptide repeat protein [Flammeovirga kamogawensis]MBB6460635.1 tetratricopeptide (TPR) repeat protein [Flammeovirga kamogawensis]QWG07990.1 tetratricopeptide repeat protein [Flammeovirga kamogawensis]TRX69797.1 tetratricopeptide repeat protein [Flammeovirga kamogawensis]
MKSFFFLLIVSVPLIFQFNVSNVFAENTINDEVEYYTPYLKKLLSPPSSETLPQILKDTKYINNVLLVKGLVEVKEHSYWNAFWTLKKSYTSAYKNHLNIKTDTANALVVGIIATTLEVIPSDYHWIRNLLGFTPPVDSPKELIKRGKNSSDSFLRFEAYTAQLLLNAFIYKNQDKVNKLAKEYAQLYGNYDVGKCVLAWSYFKNHEPGKAYFYVTNMSRKSNNWFGYKEYLSGASAFYAQKNTLSKNHFHNYLKKYSTDYVKSIYYQLYLMKWFNNSDEKELEKIRSNIENKGTLNLNVDKYAYSFAIQKMTPNKEIYRSRILFDAGQYNASVETLINIDSKNLNRNDKLEYNYRFARSKHALKDTSLAIKYYLNVLELADDKPKEYYPANSALNLGKLYEGKGDLTNAKIFYNKAKSFPKHTYKNSIDSEAKRRLNTL